MPTLEEILEVVKGNTLAWSAFLALPVIVLCIACLMPRGEGRKAIHIERALIAGAIALILAVPAIISFVDPTLLNCKTTTQYLTRDAFITAALVLELVAILWGIFSARSYITQAIYGMMTTILLPYGLILLVFPVWMKTPSLGNMTNLEIVRLIQYALIFLVPVWLIRSGEYKFRFSSMWHLLGGITFGASLGFFILESIESFSSLRITSFDLFIGAVKAIMEDGITHVPGKEWQMFKAVMTFIAFAIIVTLVVAGIVAIVRVIFKTGTKNFRSESLSGFFARSAGNLLAVLVSGLGLVLLTMLTNPGFPTSLLFILPAVAYVVIAFISALIGDVADIKHGIKVARQKESANN